MRESLKRKYEAGIVVLREGRKDGKYYTRANYKYCTFAQHEKQHLQRTNSIHSTFIPASLGISAPTGITVNYRQYNGILQFTKRSRKNGLSLELSYFSLNLHQSDIWTMLALRVTGPKSTLKINFPEIQKLPFFTPQVRKAKTSKAKSIQMLVLNQLTFSEIAAIPG